MTPGTEADIALAATAAGTATITTPAFCRQQLVAAGGLGGRAAPSASMSASESLSEAASASMPALMSAAGARSAAWGALARRPQPGRGAAVGVGAGAGHGASQPQGRGRGLARLLAGLAGLPLLLLLLASCTVGKPLTPAWQQDSNLYYQGTPARQPHTTTTPHVVSRIIYAPQDQLSRLLEKQGDVADAQHGLARMGDGTLDLGVQDAATGKWLDSWLCGGTLFVAALPNQAYRLVVKNRTPLPLQLSVGVDGHDVETGRPASLHRGNLHIPARGTLTLDHGPQQGPLLFCQPQSDMVLYDLSPRGRPGVVQVAAYLAEDARSVGPDKMRPTQVLPLSLFPIKAPEQYR